MACLLEQDSSGDMLIDIGGSVSVKRIPGVGRGEESLVDLPRVVAIEVTVVAITPDWRNFKELVKKLSPLEGIGIDADFHENFMSIGVEGSYKGEEGYAEVDYVVGVRHDEEAGFSERNFLDRAKFVLPAVGPEGGVALSFEGTLPVSSDGRTEFLSVFVVGILPGLEVLMKGHEGTLPMGTDWFVRSVGVSSRRLWIEAVEIFDAWDSSEAFVDGKVAADSSNGFYVAEEVDHSFDYALVDSQVEQGNFTGEFLLSDGVDIAVGEFKAGIVGRKYRRCFSGRSEKAVEW